MSVKICPRCQRRYVVDDSSEDFIHECNSGNLILDEEDVVVMGDWEDYTGSGTELNVNFRGSENKLFGTRAGIEGGDLEDRTVRGKRASTMRQRQHLQFINLKEVGII